MRPLSDEELMRAVLQWNRRYNHSAPPHHALRAYTKIRRVPIEPEQYRRVQRLISQKGGRVSAARRRAAKRRAEREAQKARQLKLNL